MSLWEHSDELVDDKGHGTPSLSPAPGQDELRLGELAERQHAEDRKHAGYWVLRQMREWAEANEHRHGRKNLGRMVRQWVGQLESWQLAPGAAARQEALGSAHKRLAPLADAIHARYRQNEPVGATTIAMWSSMVMGVVEDVDAALAAEGWSCHHEDGRQGIRAPESEIIDLEGPLSPGGEASDLPFDAGWRAGRDFS